MTAKQKKGFEAMNLDNIGAAVDSIVKPGKAHGRPKQNPHAGDKRVTIRMPADLHKQLRLASAEQDKPMVQIAVDALIEHLKKA